MDPETSSVTNSVNGTLPESLYVPETTLRSLTDEGNGTTALSGPMLPYRLELDVSISVGLYSTIFLLAVLGNVLVILTLVQNQGMRTITNLFLLNLAISDLMVGVLCMPFSLVGIVLKDFVFGAILCKLIPYLQAVSVSVSAWTLVAISVERYYAICHPLTSRRWQTLSHAYKIIALVWILSGLCMSPIAGLNVLQPIRDTGRHKCREEWPDVALERTYTVFLDIILLVLPLVIMTVKYSLITRTLWHVAGGNSGGYDHSYMLAVSGTEEPTTPSASPSKPRVTVSLAHSNANNGQNHNSVRRNLSSFKASIRRNNSTRLNGKKNSPIQLRTHQGLLIPNSSAIQTNHLNRSSSAVFGNNQPQGLLRRCNVAKSLRRKKRVIQMLGVVVAEFFVCWMPLYVMNTWYLFSPTGLYNMIGPLGVSLIQLLAYFSSCSNPITYCFMNRGFRIAFCHVFGCHCGLRRQTSTSHRSDSLRLTRNRSLFHSTYKASDDV